MVNFGWDRVVSLGHPSKFQRVSRLGSVTAQHSTSGRQPNCGVEQRAPPIFRRAAITLGIGPHFFFICWSVGRLVSALNGSQPSVNGSPRNLHTSLKTYVRIFFTPPRKIWRGNLKFCRISATRRQSEARNFETAQYIDKQKPDVSSTINALKTVPNLGHHPHWVLMQPWEKIV